MTERTKFNTYKHYFLEYLKYFDIRSIIDSYNYIMFNKGASKERIIKGKIGKFQCRKGTNDFQFANYAYEWGVKSYLLDVYKDYDVFMDIGTGIGDYSILMAKNGLKCIAFEPVIYNYKSLINNINLNNYSDKIKALNIGLGESEYETTFAINKINTGASNKIGKGENIRDTYLYSFEKALINSLDNLIASKEIEIEKDAKVLMKVDIEGMEVEFLKGASKFIQNHENIRIVLEDKHSGQISIRRMLQAIDTFNIDTVDKFNIVATKKIFNMELFVKYLFGYLFS